MDIITQALLGAVTGQAVSRKSLGNRATRWGAFAGIIPDFDTIIGHFGDAMTGLIYHRGFTHSLWFAFIFAPCLAVIVRSLSPFYQSSKNFYNLIFVIFIGLWTHPLLDCCTSYGTQLLAPFDRTRFAVNSVAIVDIFYTVTLLVCCVITSLLFWRHKHRIGQIISILGLIITTSYLGYGYWINQTMIKDAQQTLPFENNTLTSIHSDATLGQIFLRRVIIQSEQKICIAHKNYNGSQNFDWSCVDKQTTPALKQLRDSEKGQIMAWFARDQYYLWDVQENDVHMAFMDDIRYTPYTLPGHGLWGIEAEIKPDGTLAEIKRRKPTKRFDIQQRWKDLIRILQTTFQTS